MANDLIPKYLQRPDEEEMKKPLDPFARIMEEIDRMKASKEEQSSEEKFSKEPVELEKIPEPVAQRTPAELDDPTMPSQDEAYEPIPYDQSKTLQEKYKNYKEIREKAREESSDKEMWARIIPEIAKGLGAAAGIASKQLTPVNVNTSGIQESIQRDLKNEIQRIDQEEAGDPNSELSTRAREELNSVFKMNIPENISADQLKQFAPTLINRQMQERAIASRERIATAKAEERKAKDDRLFEQRNREEERRVAQAKINAAKSLLTSDKRYNKALDQAMALEDVYSLIGQVEDGNEAAVSALGIKLAKAMGEVGVMTDTDVVRYISGTSWGRSLLDWYTKGAKGTISKDTLEEMKSNIKVISKNLNKNLGRVYKNARLRLMGYPGVTEDEAKRLIGNPMLPDFDKSTENKIRIRRKSDGKEKLVSADNVEKYLANPNFERVD